VRAPEHALSGEIKRKIAVEITRIHTTVMRVPKNFVRVVFLSYPEGSGYAAGVEAPIAAVNCVLRSGHSLAEKKDILQQLWTMFQQITGIATDQRQFLSRRSRRATPWKWGRSCQQSVRNRVLAYM